MKLNAKQLDTFIAVMESNSLAEAGNRLCVTQPAVSRMLERFQEEVGFRAFEKAGARLVPTSEGVAFYREAKRYYQGLDRLNEVAREIAASRQGMLNVGVFPGLAGQWIAQQTATFRKSRDGLHIAIQPRASATLIDLVISGSLDLAITTMSSGHSAITSRTVGELPCVAVLPEDHPLADQPTMSLEQLSPHPMIGFGESDEITRLLRAHFLARDIFPTQNTIAALATTACNLAAEGVGYTVLPALIAQEYQHLNIRLCPIEPKISLPVYLLRTRRKESSRQVEKFATHIEAGLKDQNV